MKRFFLYCKAERWARKLFKKGGRKEEERWKDEIVYGF